MFEDAIVAMAAADLGFMNENRAILASVHNAASSAVSVGSSASTRCCATASSRGWRTRTTTR